MPVRQVRAWLAVVTVFVFLAGLGHVWLHDANTGGDGHFGTAIEQIAPNDKLAVAEHSTHAETIYWVSHSGTGHRAHQWFGIRPNRTSAPRGPPRTS